VVIVENDFETRWIVQRWLHQEGASSVGDAGSSLNPIIPYREALWSGVDLILDHLLWAITQVGGP
jgi:hypothetical protein